MLLSISVYFFSNLDILKVFCKFYDLKKLVFVAGIMVIVNPMEVETKTHQGITNLIQEGP